MTSDQRKRGQGALAETAYNKNDGKVSTLSRLRYWFDNLISRPAAFFAFLLLATVVFSVFIGTLTLLDGDDPAQEKRWIGASYDRRIWLAFAMTVLTAVPKPDGTFLDRVLAILLQIGSLAFTGFIIAFITSKILDISNALKAGRSAVIDKNHVLILGWSNRIFSILNELAIANLSERKATVVIFSSKVRADMEIEISKRCSNLGKLKVVTRTGDITNPNDLARANISGAKSIVILDADANADASIVSAILAIRSVAPDSTARIIAEVDDSHIASIIESSSNNRVLAVRSDDVISRVTAQASRQPGLAAVVLDLLDFAGDELYFKRVPALEGSSYSEALLAFAESSVIGFVESDGSVHLNPAQSTRIPAESQLILLSADDSTIVYTGVRDDIATKSVKSARPSAVQPSNILIIGWSHMGEAVISELDSYLAKGSTVEIVAQGRYVEEDEFRAFKPSNIKLSHRLIKGDIEEMVKVAKAKKYDEIIVLGYRNKISEAEADAHTMLTMLQLNELLHSNQSKSQQTRLIAEILDSRKAGLAKVAADGDLVISDNLAALLIAQLAENPQLKFVFDELFGPSGTSIQIRPIEQYAAVGTELDFADLVVAARNFSESAIGYRYGSVENASGPNEFTLNPSKNQRLTVKAGDSLIVVGSS